MPPAAGGAKVRRAYLWDAFFKNHHPLEETVGIALARSLRICRDGRTMRNDNPRLCRQLFE